MSQFAACVARRVLSVSRAAGLVCAAGLTVGLASAGAWADEIKFPEYPALNPDGSMVVFAWAGDLWSVPVAGGAATRVTSHPGNESRSAFNATGDTLAFESTRDGSSNLYVMPVTTDGGALLAGEAERLTNLPAGQALGGFSADGRALLFSSSFEPSIYRHPRMYRAPLDGGPVVRLSNAFGAGVSQNLLGTHTLFHRGASSANNRPIYRGSGNYEMWRLNQDGSFTRLTNFDGNDYEGRELPDGSVVFISSRDGQNNLYMLAPNAVDRGGSGGPGLRQLTFFKPQGGQVTIGHGVRDVAISADGKRCVFCVWDTMYSLDLVDRAARPIVVPLSTRTDEDISGVTRLNIGTQVGDAALSPDGKTMAVIARGEVFVRSIDDPGYTRRITNTVAREQNLAWSPDGRYLYFVSDRSGIEGVYRTSVTLTRTDVYPDEKPAETPAAGAASAGGDTPPASGSGGGPGGPGGGGRGPRGPRPGTNSDDASALALDQPATPAPVTPVTAPAAAPDPLSGTWTGTVKGPPPLQGGLPLTVELKLEGTSVSGSMQAGPMPAATFTGGTWDPATRTLTFSVEVQGTTGHATATVAEDGTMAGTTTVGENVFEFTLTRTAVAAPPDGAEGTPAAAEPEKPKIDHGARWAAGLRFEVEPFIVEPGQPFTSPVISPDGRWMLVTHGLGDLVIVNLADNSRRTLFTGWSGAQVEWAWDSRHIVYAQEDVYFNSDIWLLDTSANEDGSSRTPTNITRHPDMDTNPHLSADGRVLAFQSDRAGENDEFDAYALYLDRDLEGMEPHLLKAHFDEVRTALSKRKVPGEIDFAAEYTPPTAFEFDDLEDAYLRVRRLTSLPGSESVVAVTPAGDRILFNASIDGSASLFSVDQSGGDRKVVLAGGAFGSVNYLGDKIVFTRGGASTVPVAGGSSTSYPITATIEIAIADEQRQKAMELGRTFGATFYHPTMKGLNWAGLTEAYADLASNTRTNASWNRVMNMLMGEINGSHTGVSGGGLNNFSSPNATSIGALGTDLEPVAGGYRVTRVLPGSPADAKRSRLMIGDVIVAVEDVQLAAGPEAMPSRDFSAVMAGRAGIETLIEIRREGVEGTKLLLIVPTSTGNIGNLAYEQEVRDRRAAVERLSNGRLGYLHIRGMSEPSVRDFERDLYAAAHGKEGLVIDVRDNGGGSTADILLTSLTQPQHSFTVPRGADVATMPHDAYPRDRRLIYSYPHPINVIINENSFSNTEIFAHAIKHIGRGSLIGTATFGGVISTGGFGLIDGTAVRQPFRGWYLPQDDGTVMDLENHGAQPDVNVPQVPADEAIGVDRQLEAAVTELLGRIDRGEH